MYLDMPRSRFVFLRGYIEIFFDFTAISLKYHPTYTYLKAHLVFNFIWRFSTPPSPYKVFSIIPSMKHCILEIIPLPQHVGKMSDIGYNGDRHQSFGCLVLFFISCSALSYFLVNFIYTTLDWVLFLGLFLAFLLLFCLCRQ